MKQKITFRTKSVPRFRSNLNLETLVFDERGKPGYSEKHFSQQGPVYKKLFYVCRVCIQDQSFNNFENDTMKLSVNEAKLTGL